MTTQPEDWEEQRVWREERHRRMAERQAQQERLHDADPEHHPKSIPVDDPEWPDESWTAGWQQEPGS